MDPMTASYYRAILFADGQDSRPLPASLIVLHAWAAKRWQALGLGSNMTKAAAFNVATVWMSGTDEGRQFTQDVTKLGDLFCAAEPRGETEVGSSVDWAVVPPATRVVVMLDKTSCTDGEFIGARRGGWLDIRVGDETKKFRAGQVQLAGA